jgi:GR25 family glycosyltransferase involved in LPS biosynthesis/tRNA A-37 threonylcarbamoyl transferase component Bud32
MIEAEELKDHLATGVDAKIMQYEENATNISDDTIDFPSLLGGTQTYILLNMERHQERYKTSVEQLKKLSIQNFIHLKGTDGKNKTQLEQDLTLILQYIKKYNNQVVDNKIEINEFSEVNNPSVHLQDGPLGCYCSHLRAMIYGHMQSTDYTIIVEDDISITNTENIQKYLPQIPEDWDIVCMNSRGKNVKYEEPFYKFVNDFHSGHFYIVKNKCLPKIFKHMYPMTDQVDVLLSNSHKVLNIYNIPDTVYQKNLETNTQNNLDIIFSSPNYIPVTDALNKSEEMLNYYANEILPNNEKQNRLIVKHLMYDVLYNFMLTKGSNNEPGPNIEDYVFDNPYTGKWRYNKLEKFVGFFLQCTKKGINPKLAGQGLTNVLMFTLHKFTELHNTIDESGGICKAYGFGSTAHTYKVGDNLLIKRYNKRLRWATNGHDDSRIIKSRELNLLWKLKDVKSVPSILDYDHQDIVMEYRGESLYNDFNLPKDWKDQITNIFSELTKNGIFYPEFRLQNILVLDGNISFVDFGMAEFRDNCDNSDNLDFFIKNLSLLDQKFKVVIDLDARQRLISTFLKNVNTPTPPINQQFLEGIEPLFGNDFF